MDILVGLAIPVILLWITLSMFGHMVLPGRAFDVFAGIVARDIFWGLARGTVMLFMFPLMFLSLLFSLVFPSARGRHGQPRARRRHRTRRHRRW